MAVKLATEIPHSLSRGSKGPANLSQIHVETIFSGATSAARVAQIHVEVYSTRVGQLWAWGRSFQAWGSA